MKRHTPLLLLALMFSACFENQKKTEAGQETVDSTAQTTDTIRYDSLTLHYNRQVIEGREAPAYTIDFAVEFAQGESPLAQRINDLLCLEMFQLQGLTPDSAMHHYADSIASQFTQELTEFYDPDDEDAEYRFTYDWTMTGEADDNPHPKAQGYVYKIETYQGGAHGSHMIYYLNFDPETGEKITSADVFAEDKKEQLLALLTNQLLKDMNCKTVEQLRDETSITLLGDLYVDENFLIDRDGIDFVYNTYDIAPYSAGVISIRLSFKQLAGVLTERFKP